MLLNQLEKAILTVNTEQFDNLALEVFYYQSVHCEVYKKYLDLLKTDLTKINKVEDIPYLPIEFFKCFKITSTESTPEIIFESSSTSGLGISKHYVKSKEWYTELFKASFKFHLNNVAKYCHLALLPSYLEREHSSLVFQINHFIQNSQFKESGFYLFDQSALAEQIRYNEQHSIPTILWGVTYALLDFAESFPMALKHTQIIETGGMKGKRKEIVREELHQILKNAFEIQSISGEYGMTELMSQAYSFENGRYKCPPWMRIMTREINDPLSSAPIGKNGVINIIDLGNLNSCSFIATSDIGKVFEDGAFEVLGRLDNSDTRGCNLLV
jgi:hypothetical protein